MTKRFWLSQKLIDTYGSKRGLLQTAKFYAQNLLTHKYSRYSRLPNQIGRVVFVCKGNICRSAVAEYAFRQHSSVPTASIGLDTHTGKEANARILSYADEVGVDMRSHRTTAIGDFAINSHDLFVCMEPDHVKILEKAESSVEIILLGYFGTPNKLYIHDPYVSNDTYAKRCTRYIVKATKCLAHKIESTRQEFS